MGGVSALKTEFNDLTTPSGSSSPPSPTTSKGSSSAAPDGSDATTSLAAADDTGKDAGGNTTGQDLSPYAPATLNHQDVAELTRDFASWSTLMNGGTGADLQDA